ncbi:hypothetical protein [uncultured Muribaculum sp.]|uniref:hypothetical protein n=1 Tax=uncultured Muribaculum sp. TaxID=1918613 RepID=UPI002670A184|nr:hypothetical protein [uncultured Muribaculum sp.]
MEQDFTTRPQPVENSVRRKRLSIGFPSSADAGELRFPITPEGVGRLSAMGMQILIESGAGAPIHYSDARYVEAGAMVGKRADTLMADIVVSLGALTVGDLLLLRKGAMLLSLLSQQKLSSEFVKKLLQRHVAFVALERIAYDSGQFPFADILLEVDGRAAMAVASAFLLKSGFGKGILLGGVSGVIPCEVVIIGSNVGARAAAMAAVGMGAQVKMLDNDVYGLRCASLALGPAVATSVLHPNVVDNALRSADVVISTPISDFSEFTADQLSRAKKGVVFIDLNPLSASVFPTLRQVPLTSAGLLQEPGRGFCFRAVGNAAPRTAAMALSNTIINSFSCLEKLDGALSLIRVDAGVQSAVCTFMGKAVNAEFAQAAGVRPIDMGLLLSCS